MQKGVNVASVAAPRLVYTTSMKGSCDNYYSYYTNLILREVNLYIFCLNWLFFKNL